MSFKKQLLRKIAVRSVSSCLTGKPGDLHRLTALEKLSLQNWGLSAFLNRLSRDLDDGTGLAGLLLHIGKNANPIHKRKLIENIGVNWIAEGGRIRTQLRKQNYWAPFFVVVSPTMRCNLRCTGCYSALYSRDGELSEDELDRIFTECKSIGAYFAVISGGEPYLLKDTLLRLFQKHRDMLFLTFTNATLLDEPLARALGRLGNVLPAISVEGYEEHTDARRSPGVHARALHAMHLLKANGVIFGISVTYTKNNIPVVTDDSFVRFYNDLGAVFAWYFMFMPVGKDPILELVPTPEQRIQCGQKIADLRKRHPMFMADFWNDGPAVGGCMAGGRRYLHIVNSGRVEPCVYAHFGVDNIRQMSLLEAANSPFFRAIRREFPFNESANLRRPCMIIDNPEVLRKLVNGYMVPEGHAHAEDLIHDPAVAKWIDDYAERFKELTEPDWQQRIEDPSFRWFKEKEEYKLLFRFKEKR